jgi:2-haloacid dehalogenase
MLNFENFRTLTFDCYGTLIDWESGIWDNLQPILAAHNVSITRDDALKLYAELEPPAESGAYREYKTVLRMVVQGFGERLGFAPSDAEQQTFALSVKNWQPFSDTVDALRALKSKYQLAIISNTDDDLFAGTARHLQVPFDWVITAQQAQSYKPSLNNFQRAVERIGLPKDQILHVAQSLHHDIAPAKQFGLTTVWVNRHAHKSGATATPPATAQPDLTVPDLRTLVDLMGLK